MHNVRDGEPDLVVLERYDGDRTLRGNKLTYCCDCGLGHVFSYEIFKVTGSGEQYAMNIRAFRLPDKVKGATRHKGK